MRTVELLRQLTDDDRPSGVGEPFQLVQVLAQVLPGTPALERRSDEERPLDRLVELYEVLGNAVLRYRRVSKRPVAEYGTVKLPTTDPTVTSPATR